MLAYKSYFHRIGRTARAGKSGTAISFIIPKEKFRKHKPTSFPGAEHDEEILQKVEKHQLEGQTLENYQLDMAKLEAFRYRFTDALRSVTRIAIREARLKELRLELSKSEKLSRYVRSLLRFPNARLTHDSSKRTLKRSSSSVTIRPSTIPHGYNSISKTSQTIYYRVVAGSQRTSASPA
jgi:superfamily II DNA/RNA helicase